MLDGLIVVDMQYRFDVSANIPELIDHIVDRIEFYKSIHAPIIVLDYSGHDDLIDEIFEAVIGYDLTEFALKDYDDGAYAIHKFIDQFDDVEIWEAVGVNFQFCVGKTCYSLAQSYPSKSFSVNISASRSQYTLKSSIRDFRELQSMGYYGNLQIIGDGHDISAWNGENFGSSGGL